MGLSDDLLTFLSSRKGAYKLLKKYSGRNFEVFEDVPANTFWSTLSRLKKNGLVAQKSGFWVITRKGLDRLKNRFRKGNYSVPANAQRNVVVIFDIPEKLRRKRSWLRGELKNLNFIMLQQSAWFGPAPLPQKFIESLKELKLMQFLKFFEAKETDIV